MFKNTSNVSLFKKLAGTNISDIQCAECNNGPLCNNEKFFENQLFCLEKLENETKINKGIRVCKEGCFVWRNFKSGKVTQGCGKCSIKDRTECTKCNEEAYCNTEQKVHKYCWENNNKICKTPSTSTCHALRTSTNEVKKGCGKCPFHTCEECNEHLCNNQTTVPFYCFGFMGSYKKCEKADCYIAKIEEKLGDKKIDQFHYDCGTCPSGILDLSPYIKTKDATLQEKIKKINMSNVQCAQCNNKPACNSDSFFESQLFCWEKDSNKWAAIKGKSLCKKEMCFVGVDKKEMGLVQGCGKCETHLNLTKCTNCSGHLCNTEAILPPPIKCHFLVANFQPYVKISKTCQHVYDSCYRIS